MSASGTQKSPSEALDFPIDIKARFGVGVYADFGISVGKTGYQRQGHDLREPLFASLDSFLRAGPLTVMDVATSLGCWRDVSGARGLADQQPLGGTLLLVLRFLNAIVCFSCSK